MYKQDEIKEHAIDNMENFGGLDNEDLHHEMFNMDYFIIGAYRAKEWMGVHAFECIGVVKDYEMDNFGEVYTDLSEPEKVVNMYAYIVGEIVINELREEQDN